MSSTSFHLDLGRVLAWAARPKESPLRHEEYHRLLRRHREEPEFAQAVEDIFLGAGLNLIVDERDGFVVTANSDSMLRVTPGDVGRAFAENRSLIGLILLAISRTAYPEAVMLADPDRVPVFTVQLVVDTLDRAERVAAEKAEADASTEVAELEAWRHWDALPSSRPNARRRSVNDRPGAVNKVCRFLAERGYLTERGTTDGGTWQARPKFRHAVSDLSQDSDLYRSLNALVRSMEDHDD